MSFLCVLHKNSYHLNIFFYHLLPFFVQINNYLIIIFIEMTFSYKMWFSKKDLIKFFKKIQNTHNSQRQ